LEDDMFVQFSPLVSPIALGIVDLQWTHQRKHGVLIFDESCSCYFEQTVGPR